MCEILFPDPSLVPDFQSGFISFPHSPPYDFPTVFSIVRYLIFRTRLVLVCCRLGRKDDIEIDDGAFGVESPWFEDLLVNQTWRSVWCRGRNRDAVGGGVAFLRCTGCGVVRRERG